MGRPLGVPTAAITEDSALGGTDIQRSLRFRSNNSAKLTRTFGTNTSDTTKTISVWVKRAKVGSFQSMFSTAVSGYIEGRFQFTNDDQIQYTDRDAGSGTTDIQKITTQKFRDVVGWYHLVLAIDTSNGTADNRIKIYVNGTQVTDFSSSTNPTQSYATSFFRSSADNYVGVNNNSSDYFDGYMTDINFIDGQALDASYFGYTDSQTGQWRSKKFEGTYGNNGFYLKFADNSGTSATTMGKDSSGNGNNWTPNNISVTSDHTNDSMLDTPSNNFANLNNTNFFMIDLGSTINQLEEGGLFVDNPNNADRAVHATQLMQKGKKYYVEGVYYEAGSGSQSNWAITSLTKNSGYPYKPNSDRDEGAWGIDWRGGAGTPAIFYKNGGQTYSGSRPSNGQVIGMAIDLVNGKIWFHKAGTYAWGGGNPTNGTTPDISGVPTDEDFYFTVSIDSGGSNYTDFRINFGQQPFQYKPSGFDGLLNSETITVTPPVIMRPQRHFDTVLWTGNSSTSNRKISLEFKPDLVWSKTRNASYHHVLMDSVRGASNRLNSDQAYVENHTNGGYLASFDNDGFTWQYGGGSGNEWWNENYNYVAWCWKAGGTAVSNSDGDITSSVSANTEAGFSIVTYTGNGSGTGQTVGHGLGKAPKVIFLKKRNAATNWYVYHGAAGDGAFEGLNTTTAYGSGNAPFNTTAPSSTVVTLGNTDGNQSGINFVLYCWAEIPGYSSFGKYKGNGGSVGSYVHLGFKPAWLLIKRIDDSKSWFLWDNERDPYNVAANDIYPNQTHPENQFANNEVDLLANGFKLRNSNTTINASGGTYVYMAFAGESGQTPYDTFPNAR